MNNRLGFIYFIFLLFLFSNFSFILFLFLVFILLFFILDLGKGCNALSVKIIDNRLNFYFSLLILFYFILFLFFSFLFLEQLRLGFISHTVTSVTGWWRSHKTDHRTWKNEVKGSRIKWHHTAWTTYAGLMSYTWSFRVGCTVVSMDHE